MKKHVFLEIKGQLIEVHGNTPVRILSEEEAKEIRFQATPWYKAKHFSDIELLNAYLNSLMGGKAKDSAIYKAEILLRMKNK